MPRSRTVRGKLAAEVLANGLIASARNLTIDPPDDQPGRSFRKVKRQEWQNEGWYWYDVIEVFHYGVQWVGNTLSKAKLIILKDGKLVTSGPAVDVLERFFGGTDQHGEFLRQAAIHMTVAGEGYIVGQEGDSGDEWFIAAAVEVKYQGDDIYRIEGEEVSTSDSLIIRFWRPHPRKRNISDCPTRPLLPILSQIHELTMFVSAQADSRLQGAGILKLPTEVTFPTPVTSADGKTQQEAGINGFIRELAETMAAAKKDRGSAAASVPIIIQAPAEHLDKIDHLTFWSELDENAKDLRNEAIRRLALGMDMPPEALLGTGDVNHWGAWQIEDSLIKSHAEPLLALITEALTTSYLRAVLVGEGMDSEEAEKFEIAADTTGMRLRPNRSKEAIELWDRGILSDAAMLRENGFDVDEDSVDDEHTKTWLLRKIAQGSPNPEAVEAAAKKLGVELDIAPSEPSGERPLPRSLTEHPKQDPPERPEDGPAASLIAAAEVAMFHALTRAGNRIKSTAAKIEGIPREITAMDRYQYVTLTKTQLDFVLDDAWPILERLELPRGVTAALLETALDNYARLLISNRQPYERAMLVRYLKQALKDAA
jgi:hypothetical protein